jgi:PKD repeat protein
VCDIGAYERDYQSIPPDLVTISGTNTGLVGQVDAFTATIEPISATIPVAYSWQATGEEPIIHTGGLTDTVSFIWEYPGTKAITVTASNLADSVMDSHIITISDISISGLVASNDSPTTLGETTALSATIQAGSNVIYTWDFGDGEFSSGQFVNHIYPSLGTYTATVTATNSAGPVTTTTQVLITSSTYQLYLPLVTKSPPNPLATSSASSRSSGVPLLGLVVFGLLVKGWVEDDRRLPNNGV